MSRRKIIRIIEFLIALALLFLLIFYPKQTLTAIYGAIFKVAEWIGYLLGFMVERAKK